MERRAVWWPRGKTPARRWRLASFAFCDSPRDIRRWSSVFLPVRNRTIFRSGLRSATWWRKPHSQRYWSDRQPWFEPSSAQLVLSRVLRSYENAATWRVCVSAQRDTSIRRDMQITRSQTMLNHTFDIAKICMKLKHEEPEPVLHWSNFSIDPSTSAAIPTHAGCLRLVTFFIGSREKTVTDPARRSDQKVITRCGDKGCIILTFTSPSSAKAVQFCLSKVPL